MRLKTFYLWDAAFRRAANQNLPKSNQLKKIINSQEYVCQILDKVL